MRRVAGVLAIAGATALMVVLLHVIAGGGAARPAVPAVPTLPLAASGASGAALNPTDDAFLQLMIPMDETALTMFTMLNSQTVPADSRLAALAGRLAGDHRAEVAAMRTVLRAAGVAENNIHQGHKLPGMILPDDLATLRAATPAQLPVRALALIRQHLAQGGRLAGAELTAGHSPAALAVARDIRRRRATQTAMVDAAYPPAPSATASPTVTRVGA
jgi:uncharacterized protein (DUF305 family)